MEGNKRRHQECRDLGDGALHTWNDSMHDCRYTFGFRLGYGYGETVPFTPSAGMGG